MRYTLPKYFHLLLCLLVFSFVVGLCSSILIFGSMIISVLDKKNNPFLIIVIILELCLTSFFTYLFIKPLHNVYRSGSQQNDELKRVLWYNVILTLIGMISSNITEIHSITTFGTNH